MTIRRWHVAAILAVAALTAVGIWKTGSTRSEQLLLERRPRAIMGTDCQLAVVLSGSLSSKAASALDAAERELRLAEARMSTYIDSSEISRFNAAEGGTEVLIGPSTLEVLREAKLAFYRTRGVFDVTCRPLINLWSEAARSGALPNAFSIRRARELSDWSHIELLEKGARKLQASARVDLGGIAKGYAIDRAIDALKSAGAVGGLVNVGGDIRCFGHPAGQRGWSVEIRHPSGRGVWKELRVFNNAICTSGNYARFYRIGNETFSHIIDPRDGRPAVAADSVTVLASSALLADVWATALSVLGPEGLSSVPEGEGIEALVLTRSDGQWISSSTSGFEEKTSKR